QQHSRHSGGTAQSVARPVHPSFFAGRPTRARTVSPPDRGEQHQGGSLWLSDVVVRCGYQHGRYRLACPLRDLDDDGDALDVGSHVVEGPVPQGFEFGSVLGGLSSASPAINCVGCNLKGGVSCSIAIALISL